MYIARLPMNGGDQGTPKGFELIRAVLARVVDKAEDSAALEREKEQLRTERDRLDAEVREREAAERDLADAQRRADSLRAQVPTRYRTASLASWQLHGTVADQKIQRRVLNAALAYDAMFGERENPATYFPQLTAFQGSPGTGKNHIAWSLVASAHVVHNASFVFCRAQDLVRDIRGAWATSTRDASDESSSEARRVWRYRTTGLLVIDEVSRDKLTVDPTKHLYDVVADREEWMRPTILITNDEEGTFFKLIGDSLADRLKGSSDLWNFGTRSYRPNLRRPPNPEA